MEFECESKKKLTVRMPGGYIHACISYLRISLCSVSLFSKRLPRTQSCTYLPLSRNVMNYLPTQSGRVDACEARLDVHIRVDDVLNKDIMSRSDPFAVLYMHTGYTPLNNTTTSSSRNTSKRYTTRDAQWDRIGQTETVYNVLSVQFARSFEIAYYFERVQKLAVDVFDRDSKSETLSKHDFLGSVECTVPALVRAREQRLKLPLVLKSRKACGFATLIVEEVVTSKQSIYLDVWVKLYKRPFFLARADGPFLTIRRQSASSAEWITVYRSTFPASSAYAQARHTYNFESITKGFEKLARADTHLPLRFELSYLVRGRHHVVAATCASLSEWQRSTNLAMKAPARVLGDPRTRSSSANILHQSGQSAPDGKELAQLFLRQMSVFQETTFLDYVMGGCEMSLVIGIDFTASNGDPTQPGTLHFLDQYQANEYEQAIRAVGDILANYDNDQKIPAYGFGARLPPDFRRASNCFSLTGSEDPTCDTIDGVLDFYRQTLYNVRLSGPTVFADVVHAAAEYAKAEEVQHTQSYTMLLIITDGVINDVNNTINQIVRASSLPLSIVIIGVGDADFSEMRLLDGDDVPLSSTVGRDIVQFVPFRQYRNAPEMLLSKVLEEIPHQLVQYMKMKGISPLTPGANFDADR